MIPRRSIPLLALAVALSACPAGEPPPPRGSPSETVEPARGGTLKVVLAADVDSLDPHAASRPSSWFFARAVHRGLMAFPGAPAPDGTRPIPDLVVAEPDRQGSALVFTLREGLRFSSGRRITERDVVASIARVKDTGRGIARFLRGVRARSAGAGRIRFTGGRADLPWLLAHPQLAIIPAATPSYGLAKPLDIAGAGPYKITAYNVERRIVLERNDRWRAEEDPVRGAYLDGIEAAIGVSAARAMRRVADGDAHLVLDQGPPDATPPSIPRGARTMSVSSGCVRYLFMNTRASPFRRTAARTAVAAAVQRARLPGVGETAVAAQRLLPPAVLGHRTAPVIAERARRTSIRATLTVADAPRDRAEARVLRRSLARAGIRISIKRVPEALVYPDHYESPGSGTQMGLATWCADWPGLAGRNVLGSLAASSAPRSTRYSGLASDRLDRLITGAGTSATRWAAADAAVVRTGALVPLTWPVEVSVVSERLRGWTEAPMFPRGDPATLWLG